MTSSQLCDPSKISDWFWDIIRRADKDRAKLEQILRVRPIDEIRRFALEFHDASSGLWDARYTSHLVYRSEDDVEDIGHWVVSQGKGFYAAICAHPEAIAAYEDIAHADPHALAFVADGLLDAQLGDGWNLYDDYQDFADSGYATVGGYWETRQAQEQ